MSRTVHIVDYGVGNLHSVARAVEKAGARASLASNPDSIVNADLLILPGVGAFQPCIENIRRAGFVDPILEFVRSGRPFLGICVGMQLLFEYSTEFGTHAGLGIMRGFVAPIPLVDPQGNRRKVPHIGWSTLRRPSCRSTWDGTLLEGAQEGAAAAYFVHSFSAIPSDDCDRLADVIYQDYVISAAVQRENITGFQCHPEKSGQVGISILEKFVGN